MESFIHPNGIEERGRVLANLEHKSGVSDSTRRQRVLIQSHPGLTDKSILPP